MNLFTVEQLELIRRLRHTGMSVDAVVAAYRSLDQLETELNVADLQPVISSPDADTKSPPIAFRSVPQSRSVLSSTTSPIMSSATSQLLSSPTLIPALSAQPLTATTSRPMQRCAFATVPESCVFGGTAPKIQMPSAMGSSFAATSAVARPIRTAPRQPMRDITPLEDPNELEQFMSQGEEHCINDMKKFITQYSLRQTTVAQLTGVSQPYISKLLNGNHRELSLRCRRNIYAWFLNCRRNPSMYCHDPTTRLETNGDGELMPQRRERYVFRPILLRILENYFAESPFPDGSKRSEIAQICNTALQTEKGCAPLMPKEIVTPQVVANWFANKRKEMNGTACLSDTCLSTPSPSSSTAAGDSPTFSGLPQLSFVTSPLLPMMSSVPTSTSTPLLSFPTSLNGLSTPLSELLTKSAQFQQKFQMQQNSAPVPLSQIMAGTMSPLEELFPKSETETSSKSPLLNDANQTPPLLSAEAATSEEKFSESADDLKMIVEDDQLQISDPNPDPYKGLLETLLNHQMLNIAQQFATNGQSMFAETNAAVE